MKYKVFKIIFIVLIVISFSLATFFTVKGLTYKDKDVTNPEEASMSSVDVEQILEDIKASNTNLVYESTGISEFKSLAFLEEGKVKSYIVDTITGAELSIKDIIKEDKYDEFLAKEEELLRLKYPEFIVNGIINGEGTKVYVIKEKVMVVYYYDYVYDYPYTESVNLTINYNEVHDYLDFTHELDAEYQNENGYNYSADKKTVALTFDDGPSSKYNAQFLDVLARNKAHATFFMVGTMMNNCQKCVLDTYNSGNEVGSHTYNHMNIKKNNALDVNDNLKQVDDLFYKITNDHIKYVRPPYGSYSKENLENINNPLILWNIDTEDWSHHDVDYIVNSVMENVQDGSIILMHELYETSLQALEVLLPRLYAEGYQVVSVSELANMKGKTLESGHAYRAIMG
ncbi:MAG TPA: polysaccharide deacetylase family protein [Candidatus Caccenecus avistercoris]|nr:polysaccharide deacetylase family protein [Candidatus Caccenecus avistercoris]